MPESVEIPDPVAGPHATGTLRVDHREGPGTPLVLLGGMTQTLASWSGQLRPMSAKRSVLAYEARGQGGTVLSVQDCGFERHVADFEALLDAKGLDVVDLAGFSFGGRVSLAVAATLPHRIRRLVVSGVALDRGVLGQLIVSGWIATLRTGDLEALARVSLPDILGPAYLQKHAHLIEGMVKAARTRNNYEGVKALFEHTMNLPADGPWHPRALVPRLQCPVLVIGGSLDRLAPPAEVRALAQLCGAQALEIEGAGHTVAIEAPQVWRDAVEAFLDRP